MTPEDNNKTLTLSVQKNIERWNSILKKKDYQWNIATNAAIEYLSAKVIPGKSFTQKEIASKYKIGINKLVKERDRMIVSLTIDELLGVTIDELLEVTIDELFRVSQKGSLP